MDTLNRLPHTAEEDDVVEKDILQSMFPPDGDRLHTGTYGTTSPPAQDGGRIHSIWVAGALFAMLQVPIIDSLIGKLWVDNALFILAMKTLVFMIVLWLYNRFA